MYRVPRKQDKAYEVQDMYGVALASLVVSIICTDASL